MSTEKRSPSDFVKFVYGRPVIVKLYSGLAYKGVLTCLDGFMNVVLEQAEEYENDEFKCRFNDCFIRGNNVVFIAPNDNV